MLCNHVRPLGFSTRRPFFLALDSLIVSVPQRGAATNGKTIAKVPKAHRQLIFS